MNKTYVYLIAGVVAVLLALWTGYQSGGWPLAGVLAATTIATALMGYARRARP